MNDNIRVDDIEYDDDVNMYNVHVIINDGEDNDEIKVIVNEVIWKSKDNSASLYVDDMIIVDVDDDVVKEVTHNVITTPQSPPMDMGLVLLYTGATCTL